MPKLTKLRLFKVQFIKTVTAYVLAQEQKDLKRALEDVDLYDDFTEAVAKVTGIKQVTNATGLPKDTIPWTSRDLRLPMPGDPVDPMIITDGDDLLTIIRKMKKVNSAKPTKKGT